jgi:hypothetical protein
VKVRRKQDFHREVPLGWLHNTLPIIEKRPKHYFDKCFIVKKNVITFFNTKAAYQRLLILET